MHLTRRQQLTIEQRTHDEESGTEGGDDDQQNSRCQPQVA